MPSRRHWVLVRVVAVDETEDVVVEVTVHEGDVVVVVVVDHQMILQSFHPCDTDGLAWSIATLAPVGEAHPKPSCSLLSQSISAKQGRHYIL